MTINPTLADDSATGELFPLPLSGETFVLKRDGIGFECTLPAGHKLTGSGVFFLSSKRIVFIATEKSCRSDFKSFQVPMAPLVEPGFLPQFRQPAFGANYLSGLAKPSATDEGSALLGGLPAPFSLTFNIGGCGTFVTVFYKLLEELQQEQPGPLQQAASEGRLKAEVAAFVDPNDPTTLYISQPSAANGTEQDTAFEVSYTEGELAQVKIIEGAYRGEWVKCIIRGPGTTAGKYKIHIPPTTGFGGELENGVDADDITTEYLRKGGDASQARPGPCSFETCVIH